MGALGLDLAAAVSKVKGEKKEKKPAKKVEKKAPAKGSLRSRNTAQAFLRNVSAAQQQQPATGRQSTPAAAGAAPVKAPVKARAVPIGQQLKYVFDLVKAKRLALTFAQIKAETQVSIGRELLTALEKHGFLRVDATAQTIQYKPKYSLANKQELHALIRQHPLGLLTSELSDAYPEARQHLTELGEDGAIFECGSKEHNDTAVYPNDLKLPLEAPLDESIRDLVYNVPLPQNELDVDAALKLAGIPKAKRSTARLKMAVIQDNSKAGQKRKARKIRNATNVHMAHLFEGEFATSID